MDQNDVYGRVSGVIRENMGSLLRETIRSYSTVNIKSSDIKLRNVGATYVLLPVWLFACQYKGKTYMFAMNGQTGKIAGKLPVSPGRAASWFGGVSAAAFAAMLIGGQFLW
jgi:hypothetical protein